MRALLLQLPCVVRSENQNVEHIHHKLRFCSFADLAIEDTVWSHLVGSPSVWVWRKV